MFSVREEAPEPANCPMCLYAPSCLSDLLLHLRSHHPASPPLLHCPFPHCGFCYLHSHDHHCHLIHTHLLTGYAAEWKKMLTTDSDFVGKLIALTCSFLLKLGKVESSSETQEVRETDLSLVALMAHSKAVLETFPPHTKLQAQRRKRSRSPSTCSSQVSKTRKVWDQSNSSSPYSFESL